MAVYLTSVAKVAITRQIPNKPISPSPIRCLGEHNFLALKTAGNTIPRTIVADKTSTNIFGKLTGSSNLVQIASVVKTPPNRIRLWTFFASASLNALANFMS